ncbi:hypothetical protein FOFC_05142 [Fusarium oxysporum]|nr:hypothetical protein FOFC_05142 [Fusarium oxysporum]
MSFLGCSSKFKGGLHCLHAAPTHGKRPRQLAISKQRQIGLDSFKHLP